MDVAQPSVFDRFEAPPSAKLLGWTLRAIDPAAGTIEIGFTADERFLNPGGTVQGGFLAAMLDDTQGPALFGMTHGEAYAPTIDFNITLREGRAARTVRRQGPGDQPRQDHRLDRGRTVRRSRRSRARATFTNRVMRGDMAQGRF